MSTNIEYIKNWFKQISNGGCKGIPMISQGSLEPTIQCNLKGVTIEEMYKTNKQTPIFTQNWTNNKPAISLFQRENPNGEDEVWVCYFPIKSYDENGNFTGEGMTYQQKQGILSDLTPELSTKDLCQVLSTNTYSIGFGISTGIQKWILPEDPADFDANPENLKKSFEGDENNTNEQKDYDAGYDIGGNTIDSTSAEVEEIKESVEKPKKGTLDEAIEKLKKETGIDLYERLNRINILLRQYNGLD